MMKIILIDDTMIGHELEKVYNYSIYARESEMTTNKDSFLLRTVRWVVLIRLLFT